MSHQYTNISFEDFKINFYAKIGDGTCFDVLDFNLLKVVLDGIKVQYNKRGVMPQGFRRSSIRMFFYLLAKILVDLKNGFLLRRKITKLGDAKYIIGFSHQSIAKENKEYSFHFQKIFVSFGREKFCYITKDKHSRVKPDLSFSDLVFGINIFSSYNLRLLVALKSWLRKASLSGIWSKDEFENIAVAVFSFYTSFLKFDFLFKMKKFEKAFLICHYHNEAFIFACKKNRILVNEFQHGLISKADIFYVFPQQVTKVVKRALFPDKILVYGPYWKSVLLNGSEYSESQIQTLGYYHYEESSSSSGSMNKTENKIILVTTQYSASKYFIEFVEGLSPKLNSLWKIVVKIHPSEFIDDYSRLKHLSNVEITEGNLDDWIRKSEFIVTIFSTTIFDAIRLDRVAFSLNVVLFKDYLDDLINCGASTLIEIDDNPVDQFYSIARTSNKYEYYSQFNKEILQIE